MSRDLVVTRWGATFFGRRFACSTGKGGILAVKREGDGGTPAGRFRLVGGYYRGDRVGVGTVVPMVPVSLGDVWSDDPRDPAYNAPRRGRNYPFSHEKMRRPDRLYDLVGVLDFNIFPETVPGGGSAIFLHVWRRPRYPTAGCVAFDFKDLVWILERWTPRSRVVIRGG